MKNFLSKSAIAISTGLLTMQVQAASYLPTGVFTNIKEDSTATVADVMSFVVPIGLAVTVGFAVLGWTKKGTKKALN